MTDTKQRILDAAERLFGELGFDAASLRAITAEAGVNIAAVNYHFKSKEQLLRSVLTRRLRPVNDERIARLNAYEAARGAAPPDVEEIVRILVGPLMQMGSDSGPERVGFRTLFGRMYSEPSRNLHRIFYDEMKDILQRFGPAFQQALPSLPPEEVYWRLHFVIGATAHTLAGGAMLQTMSGGLCDPHDTEAAAERLVAFVAGGLMAPLPAQVSRKRAHGLMSGGAVSAAKVNRVRGSAR